MNTTPTTAELRRHAAQDVVQQLENELAEARRELKAAEDAVQAERRSTLETTVR